MEQPFFGFAVSHTLKPTVLFYNLTPDERTKAIEGYLSANGICFYHVPTSSFNSSIGDILSIPTGGGGSSTPVFPLFTEEMIVMAGFSQKMLQSFLSFFREKQLRRMALKAMLTPTNVSWSGAELIKHLKQEQAMLNRASKR